MKCAGPAVSGLAAEDFRCLPDRKPTAVPARKPEDLGLALGFRDNPAFADVAARAVNGILADQGEEMASSAIHALPRIGQQALVPLPGNRVLEPCVERFLLSGEEEDRA